MNVLQTIDLKKYYGSEPNITRALDGVSLSVEQGEFVAIVGMPGSGKSTLLNILADEPTGNLDSKTSADVLGLLKRTSMEFNQTIAMITHTNEIAQLADRIIKIEDGRIVE